MRRRIVLFSSLALTLVSCSPSGSTDTTSSPSTIIITEAPNTTEEAASEATTTTTTMPPSTTTLAPVVSDADCLVGAWIMDSAGFLDQIMEAFAADLDGATFEHTDGSYVVEFKADGTMSVVRDNWTFEVDSAEGKLRQVINSVETGTYEVEDGFMTSDVTQESFEVKTTVEVDGQTIELPTQQVDLPDNSVDPAGAFDCDGDITTVETPDELTIVLNRA